MNTKEPVKENEEMSKGIIIVVVALGLCFGFYIGTPKGEKKPLAQNDAISTTTQTVSEKTTAVPAKKEEEKTTPKTISAPITNPTKTEKVITVSSQSAGKTVTIKSVTLSKDGWVAIRENVGGEMGSVLGAAWLPKGTATNVSVELLRNTISGKTYFVTLFTDNGDKKFSSKIDTLVPGISETFTAK
jgi:hypothetical protein